MRNGNEETEIRNGNEEITAAVLYGNRERHSHYSFTFYSRTCTENLYRIRDRMHFEGCRVSMVARSLPLRLITRSCELLYGLK